LGTATAEGDLHGDRRKRGRVRQIARPAGAGADEAKLVDELPEGSGWRFEPKWDGFRCLVFRDGDEVALQSKSGKPLARYFPEVVEAILRLFDDRFVVDGELIIPDRGSVVVRRAPDAASPRREPDQEAWPHPRRRS
jgi:ATP-dependent DNA ligase